MAMFAIEKFRDAARDTALNRGGNLSVVWWACHRLACLSCVDWLVKWLEENGLDTFGIDTFCMAVSFRSSARMLLLEM